MAVVAMLFAMLVGPALAAKRCMRRADEASRGNAVAHQ